MGTTWRGHRPSCRCIDDMLQGGQNETVGTVSSHRPTDPDGLVSQVREVRRRYPKARLSGWPCDLEKAYKQVPNDATLLWLTIIVMWSPASQRPEFFLPLCQLFGGKSPPLNFARYAAWLCEIAASLFALPATHCVDDVISVEPESLASSGNIAFKALCCLTGWMVSAGKSPPPSQVFVVIGVELDLSQVPDGEAMVRVSVKRVAQLRKILEEIKAAGRLGSGEAASLTGKLGFTLCACFGRFGRAKLRPLIRRCGERRMALNTQIVSALDFWLSFLGSYAPRTIPVFLENVDIVVSYSDGEGADAGLGIAVWSTRCPDGPPGGVLRNPDADSQSVGPPARRRVQ